jgi:hypothetical protein
VWIWPGRLPAGKLATLDGDPGLGKSTLVLDLAARITTGRAMPDGHRLDGPADVVLLSAEDGMADTIRPRLDAAGADVARVHVFAEVAYQDEHGQLRTRPPSIPADIPVLENQVRRTGAALVVVDVLNAFLSGTVDTYRDQDVRRVLHQLTEAAGRTGTAVLVLRHLRKSAGDKAIYAGGGSIGIIGAARVGLVVGVDPDDRNRNELAVVKNNLAAKPKTLAYQLVDAPEHGCSRVRWLGTTDHTADDLVGAPTAGADPEDTDAAGALGQILADGPVPAAEAIKAMAAAGFSKDQAKRAKAKLGARSVHVGAPGDAHAGWHWVLPESPQGSAPPSQGSEGSTHADALPSLPSCSLGAHPTSEATTHSVHNGSRS